MIADVNGEAYTINWYYIIQTFIGKEQNLINFLHVLVSPEILAETIISRRKMNRYLADNGASLSSVSFQTMCLYGRKIRILFFSIKGVLTMSKLLHYGEFSFIVLTPEE
jgi:hypothetical protein